MNTFGVGQQLPTDSGSDSNKIAFLVRQMIARLETMKLVQVQAVHSNGSIAAAGTVDVLPLVNQIDGDGNQQPHVTVYGIPWFRLQGGMNAVICDPQEGDIGYVSVSDRDISNVKKNFTQSGPGSFRRRNLADGIYVGGCLNNVTPNQYIAFLSTGIEIADMNGNKITMDATGVHFISLGVKIGATTHVHPTAATGAPSPPTPGT